jgi:hypothetical protein
VEPLRNSVVIEIRRCERGNAVGASSMNIHNSKVSSSSYP